MRALILTATLAAVPLAAVAEPIVLTWPDGGMNIDLVPYSDELPPIKLSQASVHNPGFDDYFPRLAIDSWGPSACLDIPEPPFGIEHMTGEDFSDRYNIPIGTPVNTSSTGWTNSLFCFEEEAQWAPIVGFSGHDTCSLSGCPFDTALWLNVQPGVHIVPLRFIMNDGTHFGWMAFETVSTIYPDCSGCTLDPDPVDLIVDSWHYIGFGYETTPDAPIIAGGGLCEADITADAVLDLADITAFVGAFTGQDDAADLDGNGVFDLADLSRFITGFTTGCGLGL